MSHPSRCLAIFWKWSHLKEANKDYDALKVATDNGTATLYRLLEDKGVESLASWLSQQKAKYTEFVILMHKSGLSLDKMLFLEKEFKGWGKIRFERFSGGKNFIYYKAESDTGLISQLGKMACDANYEIKPPMLDENHHLKSQYFEPVWRYYRHSYKRRLYESKVWLLRALLGKILENAPVSTAALLMEPEMADLADHFKDLQSLAKEIYQDNKALEAAWGQLEAVWEQTQATEADLRQLHQNFSTALAALPEPIY